ncbi:hypothetical protein QBC47DRAFT_380624 [Echria macrotheca]|uniref:Uncharacterized protein n=1 Tax=Echria macrotheca TaxID=438768 RepID=A0AAJ0BEW5_9PEZI|nr:hypothetical protein QBC47DRAFT_380624 [Echria macrotheca]
MSPYEPTFYLLKRRLPASESGNLLGRVIRRYEDPTLDYTPESPSAALTPDVFSRFVLGPQHDDYVRFTAQTSHTNDRWLKFLTKLSSSQSTSGATTVSAPRITTRRLKLEGEYFAALKATPEVRRRMLEMCPAGDKVYLVVGTMSVRGGTFDRATSRTNGRTVGVSLPLAAAAGAAAMAHGVVLPCGAADVVPEAEAGVTRKQTAASVESFRTAAGGDDDGDEVFAISCKVITRTWQGLGRDVRVKARQPEYRGGQHFGESDESDSESEDEEDEEMEAAAAEGLLLSDGGIEGRSEGVFQPFGTDVA